MINKFNKMRLLCCCFGIFASGNDNVCDNVASDNVINDNRELVLSRSQSGYDGWNQISYDYMQRADDGVCFAPNNTIQDNSESNKNNSARPTDQDEYYIMNV